MLSIIQNKQATTRLETTLWQCLYHACDTTCIMCTYHSSYNTWDTTVDLRGLFYQLNNHLNHSSYDIQDNKCMAMIQYHVILWGHAISHLMPCTCTNKCMLPTFKKRNTIVMHNNVMEQNKSNLKLHPSTISTMIVVSVWKVSDCVEVVCPTNTGSGLSHW